MSLRARDMRQASMAAAAIYGPEGFTIYVKNTFIDVMAETQLHQLRSSSSAPALLSLVAMKQELADEVSSCGSTRDEASSDTENINDAVATSDDDQIHVAESNVPTLHAQGKCSPCAYIMKADGCRHGDACKFCHLHSIDETSRWFKRGKKELKKKQREAKESLPVGKL
mmetsp:Transcript_23924/g.43342  ORF Transcript_23924/g.43342 Transcript_23924/m.43342 type:complete len:169 (-) Transcript_23924:114-620(-)